MTKEEVIKFLTIMRNALSDFKEYGHDKASMVIDCDKVEAIDIAIEALSEPINCVKCKHYYETEDDTDVHGHCRMDTTGIKPSVTISREEAIKKLQKQKAEYLDEWVDYSGVAKAFDMAIEALSERPKGEWLHVEIIDDAAECSICGFIHNSHYWASTYYNFCPNCGAKMEGGDDE